jgi:radical SAM protein with 4Fe4S-binding SPASM domain
MDSLKSSPARIDGSIREPLVSIGSPLKEKAQRSRLLEEQRLFRPVIYWYLSFRCNLACAHCSVHSSPWVDTSEDLTTAECLGVIEQMAELNVGTALVTGGEFLIRPDALRILQALGEKGIGAGVETNGIHYPPGFFELAREMQVRRLLTIAISLDGGTKETHERLRGPRSFERTVEGLRQLKEQGIRFSVQCVLNGANYETIPDFYKLAQELYPECQVVQWAILNPVGRGMGLVKELGLRAEHIPAIFALISKCKQSYSGSSIVKVPPAMVPPKYLSLISGGTKMRAVTSCQFPLLGVLPNGDVTICAVSRDNQELHFGNIRDKNIRLKRVWEETKMASLRSRYMEAEDLHGICGDCVWKYSCKGACRAWAYEEGGSFQSAFPICQALEEADAFPNVYRLSHQSAAVAAKFQSMQTGCSCHT